MTVTISVPDIDTDPPPKGSEIIIAAICEDNRIDALGVLNQKQIQSWLDDGYLVIPNTLSSTELDELKQETVAIARGKYPSENLKPLPNDISDDDAITNIR